MRRGSLGGSKDRTTAVGCVHLAELTLVVGREFSLGIANSQRSVAGIELCDSTLDYDPRDAHIASAELVQVVARPPQLSVLSTGLRGSLYQGERSCRARVRDPVFLNHLKFGRRLSNLPANRCRRTLSPVTAGIIAAGRPASSPIRQSHLFPPSPTRCIAAARCHSFRAKRSKPGVSSSQLLSSCLSPATPPYQHARK